MTPRLLNRKSAPPGGRSLSAGQTEGGEETREDGKRATLSPGLRPSRLTPGLARAGSLNDAQESRGLTPARAGWGGGRPGHVTAPEWAGGPHPSRGRPPQRVVAPHWPVAGPIEIGHLGSQRSEPQPNLLSRPGCNEKGPPRA